MSKTVSTGSLTDRLIKLIESARKVISSEETISKAEKGILRSPYAISEAPLIRERELKAIKDLAKHL